MSQLVQRMKKLELCEFGFAEVQTAKQRTLYPIQAVAGLTTILNQYYVQPFKLELNFPMEMVSS